MDLLSIVLVIVYLMVTGYLGYLGYRQTKTAADYLLAGRSANPVVMALSYGAAFISTSAIVGFGGAAANFGMGLLWLTVLNIGVGIFIAFVFLGNPTRRMGHHLDAHTFPELIAKRYDSRFLQVACALIIFCFMPLYAMAVMVGGAEFMAPIFHVSYDNALYIFAVIVAAYVIAGGLKGVMLADALQGAIMLVGMVFLLGKTYALLGGPTEAHAALGGMADLVPQGLRNMGHQGWTTMPAFGFAAPGAENPAAYHLWWILVSTIVMGVGIGVLAQPQLIVRFMTVKSKQSLNRAAAAGGVFILFMTGVAFTVGPLSNVFFAQRERIECRIENDFALLSPGADGKLAAVPASASEEARAQAKRFVSYRLLDESSEAPLHYALWTPKMEIERGVDGAPDVLVPRLISVMRSIGPGTPMQGNADTIIPRYVRSAMPRWFGVLFLLTLLSAAMSTMSSQFHTMGTALGRDVFSQYSHEHGSKSILVTRVAIIVGIVVALVMGKYVRGNIIALATAIFFGLCASSFLPMLVFGLFWKRMTKAGAIASLAVGFLTSAFWLLFVNGRSAAGLGLCQAWFGKPNLVNTQAWSATWTVVDPLVVALPLSLLTAVVVSLLTKPMDKAYVDYIYGGPKPKA
jgi:solute:Na+ symporter, SSS family